MDNLGETGRVIVSVGYDQYERDRVILATIHAILTHTFGGNYSFQMFLPCDSLLINSYQILGQL